jgi:S1-C subfamily serine protease
LHVGKLPPGSVTTLTVWRPTETKPFERRVVLGKLRVELPQTYTQRPAAWRGLIVDHRLPKKLDLGQFPTASSSEDFSTPSVAVREVAEGTAAWQAGLREGMLISHVGSTPVATPADFHTAVASQSGAVKLRLLSTTDGGKQTVVVPGE